MFSNVSFRIKNNFKKLYFYLLMKFINLIVKYMNLFVVNWGMKVYMYFFFKYICRMWDFDLCLNINIFVGMYNI